MFSIFKRRRGSGVVARREDYLDPKLGRLEWDPELEVWVAIASAKNGPIRIEMSDGAVPDTQLVERASAIVERLPEFEATLQAFIEKHWVDFRGSQRDLVEYKAELTALRLSTVCLSLPDPESGMVYFAGRTEHRVWRANVCGWQFSNLVFDD